MIFLVVLVTALLTVAAAHPHPMDLHGECMAMRTQHEGRQMFGVPMPNCLKGIQPPKSHINTMKQCAIMIKKKVIMVQKERLLSLSFDMEGMMGMVKEALSECLVEKMELVGEDDALNITKILQTVSEIRGKHMGVMYMKVVVASCASKTTGDNTTEHFMNLMDCVREEMIKFCENRDSMLKIALHSFTEASVCSPVQVPPEPLMYCKECAKELGIGGFVCGSEEDEEEGIRKHGGHLRWEEEEEEQEWAVRLCTSEKMGWYNASDKTFDFEAMGNTIANFDGWQDIPETLGNVTKAIVECVPQEEGSMEVQAMLWTSCFLPRYFDSCGFKSNLTRLFFPGFGRNIMREMSKVARKFIGLGEEYLGFDDDEDDLDAEMVDAGLLAGSPEEEEGAGLLEEEEEEGDGETMTADSQEPQPMSAPMKQGEKADENSNEKSTENSEGEDTSTEVTSENTTTKPPST